MPLILSTFPQGLLDSMDCAIVVKNSNGVILSCNQAFRDLNGNVTRKLIGLTAYDYLPIKEADMFTEKDIEILNNPKGYLNYQFERYQKDNSTIICDSYKSMSYADDGQSEILVVIKTSIKPTPITASQVITPRETKVLELLVRGYSQKEIGLALCISHHTVTEHTRNIYRKLGVNNRTQAQLKAITELGMAV